MADIVPAPAAVDALERLRKQAKRVLREARAVQPAALSRLRAQLPRLAALDDATLAAEVRLADVQHALAREAGAESWTKLKRALEALQPLHIQARRFLSNVPEHPETARQILAAHPAIGPLTVHTAAAACAESRLAELLGARPALATAADAPTDWTPLLYLSASPLDFNDPANAAASVRCGELLFVHGADANQGTLWDPADPTSKLAPLYYASMRDNAGLVELLLQHGAEVNDGESIYHAVQANHFRCAEVLLAHGADINGRHVQWNNTPLYFLAGYFEGTPDTQQYLAGIRWLLEHGADPNVTSYAKAETPLHRCAAFNHGPELAELLLAHGAEVDAARADGRTPYVLAVRSGNTQLAAYLLERGADAGRLTPLDELIGRAMAGDAAGVRTLARQHPGLTDNLNAEDRMSVGNAAWLGHNSALAVLAEVGFPLDAEGEAGGTPLHAAAWHGNAAAVRILLGLGAPVNIRDKTYGSSPLGWTAHGSLQCQDGSEDDYVECGRLLLEAGADRETSINKWGEPPEGMASPKLKELLKAGGFAV
jgi:ankyrin repeat protein